MAFSLMERQKKYRKIREEKNLSQIQLWVPSDRIVEIKSIAARMIEDGSKDLEHKSKTIGLCSVSM